MEIGIRELKAHLSEYLDRAAGGEIIRVTDRGVPKAIIAPVPGSTGLDRAIDEGWVRPAARVGLSTIRRVKSDRLIRDVLAEDRE